MDLNKYKVFLTAVDAGSFTQAAVQLGYTPSGITHMMNALEEELGFQILTRGKNGVQLTENGVGLSQMGNSIKKTRMEQGELIGSCCL